MSMSSSQVDFDVASNWLEDIPMPDAIQDADELQEYLSQPPERTRVNPVRWWWDKHHVWPALARMALDYLSIPGMCYCPSFCV
jgi:hypothetical protein